MSKWAVLAENLKRRDRHQVDEINGYFGGRGSIEDRIELANGRATDALSAILEILAHLDEQEQQKEAALSGREGGCLRYAR